MYIMLKSNNIKDEDFMEEHDSLNYKWLWLGGVIGFVLVILLLIFKWWTIIIILGAGIGMGVGLLIDLYNIKKKEEPPVPYEEDEE